MFFVSRKCPVHEWSCMALWNKKYLCACTAAQMQRPSISNVIINDNLSTGILSLSLFVCPSISLSTRLHACACAQISCILAVLASHMRRNRVTKTATESDWWCRWCKPLTAIPADCQSNRSDAHNHTACQIWTETYKNNNINSEII